ncbi:hypothetical protein VTN02DRAFT_4469 [Thermoascus thermophilus]
MVSMLKPAKLPSHGHTAGIYADMSVDGPSIGTLVAVIDRAKNLPNRKTMGKQNPYCAARLGKEAKKTETDMRGGQTPRWDQELRFTVHESPDYYQLKVSIFNDDKKTDLIGETWVDLKNVIIPGGGQSDQWHPLQYKGKYAGEVRIEMTYYDTRPEDEAVVERRKEVAEKMQAKTSSSPAPAGSSSLSGPRQPKPLRRRPLPMDPTGSSPVRASAPEHVQPAQAHSSPVRPVVIEQAPLRPAVPDNARPASRHAVAPEVIYSTSSPAPRPGRGYNAPEEFQREWVPVNPRHVAANAPPYPQDPRLSFREQAAESYDPRYQQPRPTAEYPRPAEYEHAYHPDHWQRGEVTPGRYEYPPEEMHTKNAYESPPRQSNYQLVTPEQSRYHADQVSYGQRSRNPPYQPVPAGYAYETNPPESALPRSTPGSAEQYHRYRRDAPRRNTVSREEYRPEYASMQPRVEDERDEDPPPPPPVHRSAFVQPNKHTAAQPTTYQAYSPEFAPSASSTDMDRATSAHSMSSQTSYSQPSKSRLQDLPSHNNVQNMPPSLVPGYDPAIAEAESDRAIHESRASRRHSSSMSMHYQPVPQPEPQYFQAQPPEPQYYLAQPSDSQYFPEPVQRLHSSPGPVDERLDRRPSPVVSKSRSTSPDPRAIPLRKSVSPKPPPTEERGLTGVPFSPDSYDALNPNAGKSSATSAPASRYETPGQAMEAARQTGLERERDLKPIIGSDGRVIDPSDHLPTDTWAPEPERKSKKQDVVVRFKRSPQSSPVGSRPPPRETVAARPSTKPQIIDVGPSTSSERSGRHRMQRYHVHTRSYDQPSRSSAYHVSRADNGVREYHTSGGYNHSRNYRTPNAYPPSQSRRRSVSPAPASHHYTLSEPIPPIPVKVPVAQPMNQNYPVLGPITTYSSASNGSLDALSQEMKTIDIGSVGCRSGRSGRRYHHDHRHHAPRAPPVGAGYAV